MKLQTIKPKVAMASLTRAGIATPPTSYGQGRGGRPWRRKRDAVLKRDAYQCQCEDCRAEDLITLADEVDHIVPRSQGGTDDESNLRAINHDCHAKKSERERREGSGGYSRNFRSG
jgi:5-methylcytosine-specific restriction protein A